MTLVAGLPLVQTGSWRPFAAASVPAPASLTPARAQPDPTDTALVIRDARNEIGNLAALRKTALEHRKEGMAAMGMGVMLGTAAAVLSGPLVGAALLIGGATMALGAVVALRGDHQADEAERARESEQDSLRSVTQLADALEARDPQTHSHCVRVSDTARDFAAWLGLPSAQVTEVAMGGYIHDLGKLSTPDAVLHKPGKLTPEERLSIEEHPAAGDALLRDVPLEWNVHPAVRHHHERWDGSGYPDRLQREEIPLTARIVALADVWDALRSARSYKGEQAPQECLEIMQGEVGTHFDPNLAERFFQFLGEREVARA